MSNKENYINKLFHSEKKKITNYVKKQVGSLEEAEDIVQDVFLSYSGGFDDIEDLQKSISWIYSVAKNKVVDFFRKKKTYSLEDQQSGKASEEEDRLQFSDILPSKEALPDTQMMQDMVWEEVSWCLDQLPDEQRKVFEWHELEGRSFQEITEATGIPQNTLISRKRYAVLFLREHLRDLFEEMKTSE